MSNRMHANPSRTGEPLGGGAEEGEAESIARARADRRAFAPLYARYLDQVYRYCYRRLGSREAAEDATSEVFYKALAALHGYRDGSFAGWLMAIARNVTTDVLRCPRPEEPLQPEYDPPDGTATPEQMTLVAEEQRSLRRLMARLPDDQRTVLELRLAGLTGAEIATALGRSLGAVKMLQHRAVVQLREYLAVDTGTVEACDGRV